MSKRTNNPLTPDILIETLRRSNLDNILIEGVDDLMIYRIIEQYTDNITVSLLPCGGRSALLKVYERKAEFQDKRALFLCDSDLWMFLGKPPQYGSDLLATDGYSIENELFQDGEDLLMRLLNDDEKYKLKNSLRIP